jgi:protein-S-isoprenylcysteine O-methyltransferase Ste14
MGFESGLAENHGQHNKAEEATRAAYKRSIIYSVEELVVFGIFCSFWLSHICILLFVTIFTLFFFIVCIRSEKEAISCLFSDTYLIYDSSADHIIASYCMVLS